MTIQNGHLRICNTSNRISSKLKGNETYLLFDNAIYAINYIELTNYTNVIQSTVYFSTCNC